jgi:hypothetical protein
MTEDKDFKRLVRDRAAKTGESYRAARAHLRPTTAVEPASNDERDFGADLLDFAVWARDEARIGAHEVVWPELILLGLLDAGGPILIVLRALRLSPVAVRHAALETVCRRPHEAATQSVPGVWIKQGTSAPLALTMDHVRAAVSAARESRFDGLELGVAALLVLLETSPECLAIFESYGVTRRRVDDAVAALGPL